MKWNVKNALSRDVERQHLNKILAEIREAIDAVSTSSTAPANGVQTIVGSMVEGNSEQGLTVTYDPQNEVLNFAVNDFIISLTGDVSGQGTVNALRNVSIPVTIDPSKVGIPEAPIDNNAYWRLGGNWQPVPWAVMKLDTVEGEGFIAHGYDEEGRTTYTTREFEAADGELTITNPTGASGNPLYGLADLADTGVGTTPLQLFTRDAKGRVEGTEDATASDLPYVDSTTPPLGADDVQEALEIVATAIAPFVGLSPTDGDIMEYDGLASAWVATKNPRELYLDGGNF